MAVYHHRGWVDAPLETVWAFHDSIEGLRALTPAWFALRVESVVGPDGTPDPPVLEVGSEVRLSMRPLGLGPRQRWTSRIVARERRADDAWFRDQMVGGPFPRWVHTHRFRRRDGGTEVTDRVEYRLPRLPRMLDAVATIGFEPLFAYRHRALRRHVVGT